MSSKEPTARERACLKLLEYPDASYASVAWDLGISEATVKRDLSRLYRKLGVSSALQARAALDRKVPAG